MEKSYFPPRRHEEHEETRRKAKAGMKFMIRTGLQMGSDMGYRKFAQLPQIWPSSPSKSELDFDPFVFLRAFVVSLQVLSLPLWPTPSMQIAGFRYHERFLRSRPKSKPP